MADDKIELEELRRQLNEVTAERDRLRAENRRLRRYFSAKAQALSQVSPPLFGMTQDALPINAALADLSNIIYIQLIPELNDIAGIGCSANRGFRTGKLLTFVHSMRYPSFKKQEVTSASILYEMPEEGRNQEPDTDQDEEQETGHQGCVP